MRRLVPASLTAFVTASVTAIVASLGGSPARADEVVDLVRKTFEARVGPSARYEPVSRADDRAVVMIRTTAGPPAPEDAPGRASGSNVFWYYVHLARQDGVWSVSGASRALPPAVRERANVFRSLSAADLAQGLGVPEAEAEALRRRTLLAASEDEALMRHFAEHRSAFARIRAILTRRPYVPETDSPETGSPKRDSRVDAGDPELKGLFDESLIAYGDRVVTAGDVGPERGCDGPECFTLAVLFSPPEYKVGYFHAPRPETVPGMSGREYLVIRPLGDGWYFFRQN